VGFVVMMAVILVYVGIIGYAIATEGAVGEAPSP
jgi:hypothetical protein